jgi:hypothetical protein
LETEALCRGDEAERMNRFVKTSRGRCPVRAAGPVGNGEGEAEVENLMTPLAGHITTLSET